MIGEQRFVQIMGTRDQKQKFRSEFMGETQQLDSLKRQKLTQERQRDFYETQRVQLREMDDYRRQEEQRNQKRALAV